MLQKRALPVNHVFSCHDYVNSRTRFNIISLVTIQPNRASLISPCKLSIFSLLIFNCDLFRLINLNFFFLQSETVISVLSLPSKWMHVWFLIYRAVSVKILFACMCLFACKWWKKVCTMCMLRFHTYTCTCINLTQNFFHFFDTSNNGCFCVYSGCHIFAVWESLVYG